MLIHILKQYIWVLIIITGCCLIGIGIIRQEYSQVYTNATFVCLSCIGIEETY